MDEPCNGLCAKCPYPEEPLCPRFREIVVEMAKRRKSRKQKYMEGRHCVYCNAMKPTTWDHVIPRYYGGADTAANKVPCCERCNLAKGRLVLVEFCAKQGLDLDPVKRRILSATGGSLGECADG